MSEHRPREGHDRADTADEPSQDVTRNNAARDEIRPAGRQNPTDRRRDLILVDEITHVVLLSTAPAATRRSTSFTLPALRAGAEALVSRIAGVLRRRFQLATGRLVVLRPALRSQAATGSNRQLFAATNRQRRTLLARWHNLSSVTDRRAVIGDQYAADVDADGRSRSCAGRDLETKISASRIRERKMPLNFVVRVERRLNDDALHAA